MLHRLAIQRLEIAKNDLRNRILKEVISDLFIYNDRNFRFTSAGHLILINNITIFQAKGNAILQASLERRKQALHERRLALEQDVYNFLNHILLCFQF